MQATNDVDPAGAKACARTRTAICIMITTLFTTPRMVFLMCWKLVQRQRDFAMNGLLLSLIAIMVFFG